MILSHRLNLLAYSRPRFRRFFSFIDILGDGYIWVILFAVLFILYRRAAFKPCSVMFVTGCTGILLHTIIKRAVARERPYQRHPHVIALAEPLDRYSFPSGHTLHTVAVTCQLAYYFPEFLWFFIPFTVALCISRLALGLHYLSDVVAGIVIGVTLAVACLTLLN